MIPKSNIHGSGGNLADYLVKGGDGEKAELIQVRGFAADDIKTAFLTIQAIAETHTNCEKPFLHSYYRLAPGEELTKEQWLETADRMEVALGLVGQPRAVAFHYVEDGSTHMHVGWSRIDEEKMRAIDPGLYINKQMEVARELEKQFGLRQLDSERDPDRGGPANRAEFEEARRLRSDLNAIRQDVRDSYLQSDSGAAFKAALEDKGLILAQGEKRDFVILDQDGGLHALGKRLVGETAEDIRGKLGDLDKASLPTVDQARAGIERGGYNFAAASLGAIRDEISADRGQQLRDIRRDVSAAWTNTEDGQGFAAALEEKGFTLARGDRRDFVILDQEGNPYNLARMVEGARTADIRSRMADIDRASLPSVADARAAIEARGDVAEGKAAADGIGEERDAARLESATVEHVDNPQPSVGGALGEVADGAAGIAQGVSKGFEKALEAVARPVEIFANIIADMFGASKGEAKAAPAEPVQLSPAEERQQRYKALAALDRIAESLRTDGKVSPADVQSLTPAHLQGIKEGGPEYLIRLAQWHESAKERDRQDELGRERER